MGRGELRTGAKINEEILTLRARYDMDNNPKLTYQEAELKYGIARSTLSDWRSRRKKKNQRVAHEHQQKLPLAMEEAVVKWCHGPCKRHDLSFSSSGIWKTKKPWTSIFRQKLHVDNSFFWIYTKSLLQDTLVSWIGNVQRPTTLLPYETIFENLNLYANTVSHHEIHTTWMKKDSSLAIQQKWKWYAKQVNEIYVTQNRTWEMLTVLEAVSAWFCSSTLYCISKRFGFPSKAILCNSHSPRGAIKNPNRYCIGISSSNCIFPRKAWQDQARFNVWSYMLNILDDC